jgi:hypothetical protein
VRVLPLKPFVLLDSPALFGSALPLGLTDEVPDLGGDALALGHAHARRVLGNFLGGAFHLVAQLAGASLGFGVEVGDAGHLDEFFLRLLETRDGIALPCFRPLSFLALILLFPLRTSRALLPLHRRFLFRSLGACGLHPASLCVIEGRVLGPRAGKPFLRRAAGAPRWFRLAADDGTISIERGERHFAPGERVMFLKNDRDLGVRNGTLGTVTEVKRDAMRVVLDGAPGGEVSFNLRDYAALDYGYGFLAVEALPRRHQPRDFLAMAGNGDFLAAFDLIEQLAEFVFCLECPNLAHKPSRNLD